MNHRPIINLARELRHRQTDAERLLWTKLRTMRPEGIRFRRQHPLGDHIVDFVCLEKKLVIEVDGGQHNEDGKREEDKNRTKWLESEGYRVIRFWNNDVLMNIDGVTHRIMESLG